MLKDAARRHLQCIHDDAILSQTAHLEGLSTCKDKYETMATSEMT